MIRVDRWLWAVRLFKTRGEATDACRGGHVRVNGRTVKAAATVVMGDQVVVRTHGVERTVEVRQLIEKRVGGLVGGGQLHRPHPAAPAPRGAGGGEGAGRRTTHQARAPPARPLAARLIEDPDHASTVSGSGYCASISTWCARLARIIRGRALAFGAPLCTSQGWHSTTSPG